MPALDNWIAVAGKTTKVEHCILCSTAIPKGQTYAMRSKKPFGNDFAHISCALPSQDDVQN